MTMAPITNSDIELHHVFHELKQLQQEIHALQLKIFHVQSYLWG